MIYLKGILAGLLAAIGSVTVFVVLFAVAVSYAAPAGTAVVLNVRPILRSPFFWLVAIASFGAAFYWVRRKSSKPGKP